MKLLLHVVHGSSLCSSHTMRIRLLVTLVWHHCGFKGVVLLLRWIELSLLVTWSVVYTHCSLSNYIKPLLIRLLLKLIWTLAHTLAILLGLAQVMSTISWVLLLSCSWIHCICLRFRQIAYLVCWWLTLIHYIISIILIKQTYYLFIIQI